jgi:hypothetical protein
MGYIKCSCQKKRNGVISIFLCIILSAVVLSESLLWLAACKRAEEADLMRCMRLQTAHALSCYNEVLLDYYGIYVVDESLFQPIIFETCNRSQGQTSILIEPTSALTKEAIRNGIVRFMLIRMPAYITSEILSRISLISDLIDESGVRKIFESAGGSSAWLHYLADFISKKTEWSATIKAALEIIKEADCTGIIRDIESFFESVQYIAERGGTTFLQGDMEVGDVLDVTAFGNTLDLVESLYSPDLPETLETCLMDIYAVSFFDSFIVNEMDGSESKPEENVLGRKYEDLHSENQNDLEYILTGVDDDYLSAMITNQCISDIRVICNFVSNIMNKEKMDKALVIANVLSTCIKILSAGKAEIPAKALQYLVIFIWSIADGISDSFKIARGESVPLLTSDSFSGKFELLNDALMTDYRDYINILLFLVPAENKSERMLQVLTRDAGGEMYSGVLVSSSYDGTTYSLEESYDAYKDT